MITDRERAVFEAGIKLGALYHQWVGTPISRHTAATVERAIESAVALQPFVEEVRVRLDRELMTENPFGYSELRGEMFEVELTTRVNRAVARTRLAWEDGYPLMTILDCDETA